MSYRRSAAVLVTAVGIVVAAIGAAVTAGAEAPAWSGIDARNYDGAIPAPGVLIDERPLDPALSVGSAGRAERSEDRQLRSSRGRTAVAARTARHPGP